MRNKIKCIMLVDDNPDDNFIHTRVIKKKDPAFTVVAKRKATEALEYLKSKHDQDNPHPNLVFLDINMPGMNGWEFLGEYVKMSKGGFESQPIVVILTTSNNPDDRVKANSFCNVADFKTKPLTKEMLEEIIDKYF